MAEISPHCFCKVDGNEIALFHGRKIISLEFENVKVTMTNQSTEILVHEYYITAK